MSLYTDWDDFPNTMKGMREEIARLQAVVANHEEAHRDGLDNEAALRARVAEVERTCEQCARWSRWCGEIQAKLAAAERLAEERLAIISRNYPMIAGRVIQLQEAGEDNAAEAWNRVAREFNAALAPAPAPGEGA